MSNRFSTNVRFHLGGLLAAFLFGLPYLGILALFVVLGFAAYAAVQPFPSADALSFSASNAHGHEGPYRHVWFAGSDCIANQATGDFYPHGQNSSHCELGEEGASLPTKATPKGLVNVPPTTVVVVPPTKVVTPPTKPTDPTDPTTPVVNPPADDTCKKGNPGNLKCNGNAGEDPNNKGTMPADNAGGGGNGQHGNQGQGGNGNSNANNDHANTDHPNNAGGNGNGNGNGKTK